MSNLALKFETPNTLDDALGVIAAMRDQMSELAAKAEEDLAGLREKLADAESEAKEASDREDEAASERDDANERADEAEDRAEAAEWAVEQFAGDVACVALLMKSGRHIDAAHGLDRALQEFDDDCKARMSAVILPAQKALAL